MKRLCTLLACLAIPLQLGARAENPSEQLAYDACYSYLAEDGWLTACEIRISSDAGFPTSTIWGTQPDWSSDGLRIALTYGSLRIYDVAHDSSAVLPAGSASDVRWSPDDSKIAFTSQELFVINADGSALTRVTDNVGFRGGYAWSPDGTTIAFGATVNGVPELFLMQPDGTNKVRLTYNVGFDVNPRWGYTSTPSWSADGTRIAFDCANDICSINADGTNFTRLTADPVQASAPVFSPVNDRIAFITRRFGASELAILEEDGAVTRLAAGHNAVQHAWSPSAESLAFVELRPDPPNCMDQDNRCVPGQNDMVYRVNSDGNGLQEVGLGGHHPRWGNPPGQPAPNAPPVATFTATCSGPTCTFDGSASSDPDGTIASYTWIFGDGSLLQTSGTTTTHVYGSGIFEPKLQVIDNGGRATTSAAVTVTTVNALPVAAFSVTCVALACTFDASASTDDDGIQSYYWNFGDGGTASAKVVTYTYATAGTYQSSLTVSDKTNQAATSTRSVTVAPPAPPPVFELHVGNLSGSATTAKNTWNALVTVQIHRDTHAVMAGVTVSGTWSDGAKGTCLTDTAGKCVLSRNGLTTKTSSIALTVAGATFGTYIYKPAANHDVDGGSNGTSIVVKRK